MGIQSPALPISDLFRDGIANRRNEISLGSAWLERIAASHLRKCELVESNNASETENAEKREAQQCPSEASHAARLPPPESLPSACRLQRLVGRPFVHQTLGLEHELVVRDLGWVQCKLRQDLVERRPFVARPARREVENRLDPRVTRYERVVPKEAAPFRDDSFDACRRVFASHQRYAVALDVRKLPTLKQFATISHGPPNGSDVQRHAAPYPGTD